MHSHRKSETPLAAILGFSFAAGILLASSLLPVFAADSDKAESAVVQSAPDTSVADKAKQKAATENLLKTCMAATWDDQQAEKKEKRSKKGPLRKAARHTGNFLASGIEQSTEGVGRDLLFVFSAQNNLDPYAGKAPTNKPYEFASFRLVDGTMCSVTKYPDGSERIVGGFADGTIIAPLDKNKYVVGYPNGARGTMEKTANKFIVNRPDNTVTTVEKTVSGNYKVHNSKFGYMGEGLTDQTGLRYDFGSLGKGTF